MIDRERLVQFDGAGFGGAVRAAMGRQHISINRLAAESLVPYQTVYRLVTAGDVRNIDALLSVGQLVEVDPLRFIQRSA